MSRLNEFLQGIRVLDLSRHLPGPLATLFLADMGAEVLKVEPPGGDELRAMGPRDGQERPVYFEAVNAGKTTRRSDLTRPEEKDELLELVSSADVLIESFRPGAMARLGLGYEALRTRNSRLIYCSLNGFGHSGPRAQVAAHDVNYLALGGALFHNDAGGTPFFDPPVADCAGALFAALTIVGALQGRSRNGKGCHIDLALGDAVMPLQIFHVAAFGVSDVAPRPAEGLLNGGAACYRVYETADGRRISLGALEPKFWRAFCRAAERPDWEGQHRDPLPQGRLIREVSEMFRGVTLAQCEERSHARTAAGRRCSILRKRSRRPTSARAGSSIERQPAPCRRCFPPSSTASGQTRARRCADRRSSLPQAARGWDASIRR